MGRYRRRGNACRPRRAWNDLTASVIRDFKNLVKLVKGNPSGKQKATLVDTDGKKLKEGKDYTVSYEYGNYENGKYNSKAVYTGTGSYSGTVEKYFNRTIEAPQIVKVEQKVLDKQKILGVKGDSIYRYYLETRVYVKPPTWLLSAKLDKTWAFVGIYALEESYNPLIDNAVTGVEKTKIMKEGTYRLVFYTSLQTQNGKTKQAYIKNIVIAPYIDISTDSKTGYSHAGSVAKGYKLPAVEGNVNTKTKRSYNSTQLKKMKRITLTPESYAGSNITTNRFSFGYNAFYNAIDISKKLYK